MFILVFATRPLRKEKWNGIGDGTLNDSVRFPCAEECIRMYTQHWQPGIYRQICAATEVEDRETMWVSCKRYVEIYFINYTNFKPRIRQNCTFSFRHNTSHSCTFRNTLMLTSMLVKNPICCFPMCFKFLWFLVSYEWGGYEFTPYI